MGGEQSNLIPKEKDFEYMTITIRYADTIRLLYASDQDINITREVIQQTWPRGIQKESLRLGSEYRFKLYGTPFMQGTSFQDASNARLLACHLLYRFHNSGWKLICSSDLSRETDLTTWFFQRSGHEFCPYLFGCISLSSFDTLQIINIPVNLHEPIKTIVRQMWIYGGIQSYNLVRETLQIKLKGTPWHCSGAEGVDASILLHKLMQELHNRQWILHTSCSIKSTADSMFFRYDPRIIPEENSAAGFIISLNNTEKIRMIVAPPDVTQCVKDTIVRCWGRGIQREEEQYGAWDFKLSGTPWWAGGQEAVESRFLITKVIEAVLARGWIVQTGVGITRRDNDEGVFMFQRSKHKYVAPKGIDKRRRDKDKSVLMFQRSTIPPGPVFCLSLNGPDKLRLICAPQQIVDTLRNIVAAKWLFGSKREGAYGQSWEIKVNENPWCYGMSGHDGAHGRILLCYILQAFGKLGWRHLLSADVAAIYVKANNHPDYPTDVHSWWFVYDPALAQQAQQMQFGGGFQYGQPQGFAPPPSFGTPLPSAPPPSFASGQQPQMPCPDQPPSYDAATKDLK